MTTTLAPVEVVRGTVYVSPPPTDAVLSGASADWHEKTRRVIEPPAAGVSEPSAISTLAYRSRLVELSYVTNALDEPFARLSSVVLAMFEPCAEGVAHFAVATV